MTKNGVRLRSLPSGVYGKQSRCIEGFSLVFQISNINTTAAMFGAYLEGTIMEGRTEDAWLQTDKFLSDIGVRQQGLSESLL